MGSAEYRDPEGTYSLPRSVECPFCGGENTYLETPFGSVLSVAQYYCRDCRTIFEWVKRRGSNPPERGPSS